MKRFLLASILLGLCLLSPASSQKQDYHYALFEDLQKLGDVSGVTQHSDLKVTYELNYPYWLVRNKTIGVIEDCVFGIADYQGEEAEGRCLVTSGYLIDPLPPETQQATKMQESRLSLVLDVVSLGPKKTSLDITFRLEVRNSSQNPNWQPVYQKDQMIRDVIGDYVVAITLACRYTVNKNNQIVVREAYKKEDQRHGVGGFEMPPADPVSRETGYSEIRFQKP